MNTKSKCLADPSPLVVELVRKYGAARVAKAFAVDVNVLRRYLLGSTQRFTRWWFEINAETVVREFRPSLHAVTGTTEDPPPANSPERHEPQ